MNTSAPAFSIRSLTHSYDGDAVLDIPALEIPSGQIWLFTGPNGSGKSTLLSILGLLLRPISGSVLLYGTEAIGTRDLHLRRNVTLVRQKPVLFSMTVRNNIGYGLRAIRIPSREAAARVDRILGKTGLRDLAGKQAGRLSGGEAQRVALARGLVLETPVILLDEPTNSLDEASRLVLLDLLQEAHARGATIVIASHDESFFDRLNPRILRMTEGKITIYD